MRFAGLFLLRLLVAVLIIGAILYIFVFGPRNSVSNIVNDHIKDAAKLDSSLQKSRERLKNFKSPSSITPGRVGARAYATKLDELKNIFEINKLMVPKPIESSSNSELANDFNAIIKDKDYISAVEQSNSVLETNKNFFSHQSAAILALANLLEYDPKADLSTKKKETIFQHLSDAKGGLEATIKRLHQIPKYDSDKNFSELVLIVQNVQRSRDQLESSVGKDNYASNKAKFINDVKKAQEQIIEDREEFWKQESLELFNATDLSQKIYNLYLIRLQHLK